jgi:hypothetical protein
MFLRVAGLVFGALAIVAGVAMVYPPAGIIVAGAMVMYASLVYDDGGAA